MANNEAFVVIVTMVDLVRNHRTTKIAGVFDSALKAGETADEYRILGVGTLMVLFEVDVIAVEKNVHLYPFAPPDILSRINR